MDMVTTYRAIGLALLVAAFLVMVWGFFEGRNVRIFAETLSRKHGMDVGEGRGFFDRQIHELQVRFTAVGVDITASELASIWIGVIIAPGAFIVAATGNIQFALVMAAIGACAPQLYLRTVNKSNARKFGQQLGTVLPMVASNLKSGLSLQQSLTTVANSMPNPIRDEFAHLGRDIDAGIPLDRALMAMAERTNNRDLAFFASAVKAQQATGGSLGDVVESVGATIRSREEIRQEIHSKTSQARATGALMIIMPPIMLAITCLTNSMYAEFYASPIGWIVIGVCALLEFIGYKVISKMADIQYE